MKFEKDGDSIEVYAFEVGDVFDDPMGNEYEIVTTALKHWWAKLSDDYHPWVVFKRLDQKELFGESILGTHTYTCDVFDLQKDFEDPYEDDEDPQRKHFFEFKYNQFDEINKTFK